MLWMATVGLVKGADRTAERQLRAYISVEPAHFDFKRGTNKAILCVARFKIKNSGQTPAYNVRIDTDFRVAPWPLTGDLATLQKNAIQFNRSIGPNDFVPGGAEKGQNIANAGPTDRLYLLGRISYRDAFEKERETWFCGSIKQSAVLFDQPFVPHSLQIDFAWAERHNEAT
jgi:hypothetical protein